MQASLDTVSISEQILFSGFEVTSDNTAFDVISRLLYVSKIMIHKAPLL